MAPYQQRFIDLARRVEALRFGEFTLKSGRVSPYFFNAGQFQTGAALAELGRCYAAALMAADTPVDMLFGPAYKGIPLAATTAIALADHHHRDLPYAFNRKEKKTYGEGNQLVGAPLKGRVLIVDDVISAGLAVRESVQIIRDHGAEPAGVLIGLNRQERGQGERSAAQEVTAELGIPVISIISLQDIIRYVEQEALTDQLARIRAYRDQYGVD